MACNKAIELSKLLDLHLSRSIGKFEGGTMSGKLKELAERMRETRRQWDDQADQLLAGMDKLEARGRAAFEGHAAALSAAEAGFKEMEAAVRELEGSNSQGNEQEGSGGSGADFQGESKA